MAVAAAVGNCLTPILGLGSRVQAFSRTSIDVQRPMMTGGAMDAVANATRRHAAGSRIRR